MADPPNDAPERVIGVGDADEQVLSGPPAVTDCTDAIVIVTVPVICLLQPVVALVAKTLYVVVDEILPVGKLIVPPLPATALPTLVLPVLFLN